MPPLNEKAKGVYVIAATPFGEDGSLDLAAAASRLLPEFLESPTYRSMLPD